MIKVRPILSFDERLKLHKAFGVELVDTIRNLDVDVVKVKGRDLNQSIVQLLKDPRVLHAEPNHIATVFEMTNDPRVLDRTQWGLFNIKAANEGISGWNYSKGNSNVKIAILDTGIDSSHEDLQGKVTDSHNCTNTADANDFFGHGTHVAGIAAASTNNGKGVGGVGYNASLINAKSLSNDGYGYYSWIADCIVWSADHGAKVINMSLGGSYPSKILEDAVNYAWNKGVVIVAAAGNSGSSSPNYPANFRNVISVAATDRGDNKTSWSTFGKWVDIAAPGAGIYSTMPVHPNVIGMRNYGNLSGTSMATPHAAGLAALVWSSPYGTSNAKVRERIALTADKVQGTGKYWKYGRINALAALQSITITIVPTKAPAKIKFPSFYIRPLEPIRF